MLKNRYGNQVEIDLSMPEPIQQFESEEQDENNDTMNDANNQQLDSGDMLRIVTWRVFFLVFFFTCSPFPSASSSPCQSMNITHLHVV